MKVDKQAHSKSAQAFWDSLEWDAQGAPGNFDSRSFVDRLTELIGKCVKDSESLGYNMLAYCPDCKQGRLFQDVNAPDPGPRSIWVVQTKCFRHKRLRSWDILTLDEE